MSESSGEKTELPTEKRLRDAREKGQVAKSADIVSTALLLAIFLYFFVAWPGIQTNLMALFSQTAAVVPYQDFEGTVSGLFVSLGGLYLQLVIPLMVVVIVAAIAGNVLQFGFLLTLKPLTPDLNKLSPISGAKKIFSMKSVFNLGMNLLKVSFLGTLLYIAIRDQLNSLLQLPYTSPAGLLAYLPTVLHTLFTYTILAFVVFAAIDYGYQRHNYMKELKMTKDEVKREYKEQEGDPIIKGKRKQLAQEMAMNDSVEYTRKASVLVTNPTHLAIALYYNKEQGQLPFVVAKGEGATAHAMIKAAQEAGVPIMQNIPLAHDLFDNGHLMEYVPTELIRPVAEVLKWVEKEGRTKSA